MSLTAKQEFDLIGRALALGLRAGGLTTADKLFSSIMGSLSVEVS